MMERYDRDFIVKHICQSLLLCIPIRVEIQFGLHCCLFCDEDPQWRSTHV